MSIDDRHTVDPMTGFYVDKETGLPMGLVPKEPWTKSAEKLDGFLKTSISELKRQPMAGGKFFALIDEIKASERRLDTLAEPLLEKMAAAEAAAQRAVEAKHATIDAALDYIKRMESVTHDMEGNGGPPLSDSSKP